MSYYESLGVEASTITAGINAGAGLLSSLFGKRPSAPAPAPAQQPIVIQAPAQPSMMLPLALAGGMALIGMTLLLVGSRK